MIIMKLFLGERKCEEFEPTSFLHWFVKGLFVESFNFKYSKTHFLEEEKVRKNSGSITLSRKMPSLSKCFATQFYKIEKYIKMSFNKL